MMRKLLALCLTTTFGAVLAAAQSTATESLADRTPTENARGGAVRERAPGRWIDAARARHNGFIDDRVNNPRSGNGSESDSSAGSGSSGSGSLADLSSLSGLLGLSGLGGLTGSLGNVGGLADLGSLLGGLGGSTLPPTSTGSGSSNSSSNGTIDPSEIDTLEELIAWSQQMNKSSSGQEKAADDSPSGGAVGRLPSKAEVARAQQTQETDSFRVRLLNSWTQTFFTALSLGFQSSDFINALADSLRPILVPDTTNESSNNTNGDTQGAEDINPSNNNNGGSNSII